MEQAGHDDSLQFLAGLLNVSTRKEAVKRAAIAIYQETPGELSAENLAIVDPSGRLYAAIECVRNAFRVAEIAKPHEEELQLLL